MVLQPGADRERNQQTYTPSSETSPTPSSWSSGWRGEGRAAGFIGSHVTAELLRRGRAVRSYERTHAAMEGVDCVIHLAALAAVLR
jgi:hypothetical protein